MNSQDKKYKDIPSQNLSDKESFLSSIELKMNKEFPLHSKKLRYHKFQLDFWYGWSETKGEVSKRGWYHEKIESSSYHSIYRFFYPQQRTYYCYLMGWKRRFEETYQRKGKLRSAIWWAHYLEFYETNFKCSQAHALKENHAQRFKTCQHLHLRR